MANNEIFGSTHHYSPSPDSSSILQSAPDRSNITRRSIVSSSTLQNMSSRKSNLDGKVTEFSPAGFPLENYPLGYSTVLRDCLSALYILLQNQNLDFLQITEAIYRVCETLKICDIDDRNIFLAFISTEDSIVIPHLIRLLEGYVDKEIVWSISEFFHEVLRPTAKSEAGVRRRRIVNILTVNNFAEFLLRNLKKLPSTALIKTENGFLCSLRIIAKLASKDEKLAVKCRLIGAVKFIHQLVQNHSKDNQLLLPLLIILKFVAKNSTNQILLGKEGCVITLMTLLNSVPKNHWAKIKLILENLCLITKLTYVSSRLSISNSTCDSSERFQVLLNCLFESNILRLLKENGLNKAMSFFSSWEKIDKRYQTKIIRNLIILLSHICDSKHGRKGLYRLNIEEIIHKFIVSCPTDQQGFASLLELSLNLFLKCSQKNREIPLNSLKGTVSFSLPSAGHILSKDGSEERELGEHTEDSETEEDITDDAIEICFSEPCKFASSFPSYKPQTAFQDDLMSAARFFAEFELSENDFPENSEPVGSANLIEGENVIFSSSDYMNLAAFTRSIIPFVKIAYPDLVGAEGPSKLEPFYQNDPKIIKEKSVCIVDRVLKNSNHYPETVVFDLDSLIEEEEAQHSTHGRSLGNCDESIIGKKTVTVNHLLFESRFESGNLRRAIQIAPYEYDLILNPDVNSNRHHQWFYFEVSNMESSTPYILNVINNEKPDSEFNYGMKPVLFSVKEALLGECSWMRTGYNICYHKNHFTRASKNSETIKQCRNSGWRSYYYYSVSFTINFAHANDVVYIAYHYPYTFTRLQSYLSAISERELSKNIFFKNQVLCNTLNRNVVPVVTITARDSDVSNEAKEIVFLTARVHPGESNSSWVIEGVINHLLGSSCEAFALRRKYIFKIVPMLNPEGVIHGNQRCGLTDEDLNRKWRNPDSLLHPSIYWTKALVEYCSTVIGKPPFAFCDFHGHSRQKNVFMYGCSKSLSWWPQDRQERENDSFLDLPRSMEHFMKTFSLQDCRFDIEKARESTARVAIWRQFNVVNSYTVEASTSGCDTGIYKNFHVNPKLLKETGQGFCLGLNNYSEEEKSVSDFPSYANYKFFHDVYESYRYSDYTQDLDNEVDFDLFQC